MRRRLSRCCEQQWREGGRGHVSGTIEARRRGEHQRGKGGALGVVPASQDRQVSPPLQRTQGDETDALWLVVVPAYLVLRQHLVPGPTRRPDDIVARVFALLRARDGWRGGRVLALVEAGAGAEAAVCACARERRRCQAREGRVRGRRGEGRSRRGEGQLASAGQGAATERDAP